MESACDGGWQNRVVVVAITSVTTGGAPDLMVAKEGRKGRGGSVSQGTQPASTKHNVFITRSNMTGWL